MDRNSKASLSPSEVASLRGLKVDPRRRISGAHRELLLSMDLVVPDGAELKLSEIGNARLEAEKGDNR